MGNWLNCTYQRVHTVTDRCRHASTAQTVLGCCESSHVESVFRLNLCATNLGTVSDEYLRSVLNNYVHCPVGKVI